MSNNLKIVIVEDHKGFSEAFTFYIENKLNHKVLFVAKNAKEIYDYEAIYNADIIFMDIELPDENGIQIAKKLLFDHPYLKIIAMTMYEDNVYLTEIISAGFKAALFKSNFYVNLKAVIENVMQNKICFPDKIKL